MKYSQILFLLVITSLIFAVACGSDSGANPDNQPPGNFVVTVSNITANSCTISWSESVDPDGDPVSYSFTSTAGFTGGELVTSTSGTSADFSDLTPSTLYEGTINASDGQGGENSAPFSFSTLPGSAGNQNPGSFTVTVMNITHNTATLSWTESTDPDGDIVSYSVTLGGNELVSSQAATTYDLTNLSSGANLSGNVTANDGNGGSTVQNFNFRVYVIDISRYSSMPGFVSATLIDCDYVEGGTGKCYEIVFDSNPVNDDGPYCPATTTDVGGLGNYNGDGDVDGTGGDSDPTDGTPIGLSIMNAALFNHMEADGYDIIDGSGNIRISDFSGMDNPNFGYCLQPLVDDNLTLTFQIPVNPEDLSSPDNIDNVEYIGLALDGVPINGEPPLVAGPQAQGEGKIPSLDRCGGHHDPAGYYHWHFIAQHMNATLDAEGLYTQGTFECTNQTQSTTALVGYARDGYPIYSANDMGDVAPTGLDACNGHVGATEEYPDGVYHYHASTDVPNVPTCVVGKQALRAFDKPN